MRWRERAGSVIILLLLLATTAAAQETKWQIDVTTDRPDAIYSVDETVTFHIALSANDKPVPEKTISYRITRDGLGEIDSGTLTTAAEPVELQAKLDQPGFIRCEVSYSEDGQPPVRGMGAAGVEPTSIAPSLPPPVDFERFWKRQRSLLESHPAEPILTQVDSPDPDIQVFDVQMECPGGAPLSGYLAVPINRQEKSLPAILLPHSAGVRSSDLNHAVHRAKLGDGAICFDFNAHGLPNGQPDEYYQEMFDTKLKGYPRLGASDREEVYFRGMVLRLLRAIELITARPEWDEKTLIVAGSSQGGGQALIAAGLEPRITLCLASVPAMCDHTGFAASRVSGWPKLVELDEKGKPVDAASVEVARYVDAMNFAPLIKCQTVVTVGFVDAVCPPTSVYAAYNAIASENKRIINRPQMGHTFSADLQWEFEQVIEKHLEQMKQNQ